jgi:hypothetical protein
LSPFEKERVMAVVARILGYSLLTAGLGAWFGYALFGHDPGYALPAFLLACVGAIVGAVAGAAGELVTAQRRLTKTEVMKPMAKTFEVGD